MLLYVADSGHVPYGTKPPAFIRERSETIVRFLLRQAPCDAIVVACNTATTHAVDHLRGVWPCVPIVGMEPAIKPAVQATRSGVIGVLATGATLGGDRFEKLLQRFTGAVEVLTQPCPGLVEQVEAGEICGPATDALLRACTAPLLARGADTLVLGCTHYPFLRPALERLVGPNVAIIDTGLAVARQVARVLGRDPDEESPSRRAPAGPPRIWTSGDAAASTSVVARLWGSAVHIDQLGR